MDEEVELDVEGFDDDGSSPASLHIDPNELPSSSSHLSLDVTEHPWLMFNDNFSDHIPAITLPPDMDPSSRATIEQMILEEHSYLHKNKHRKKNTGAKSSPNTTHHLDEKSVSYRKWTQQEKQLFKKGIEEHGHNWKEIAKMIKRKSIQQVKNFATRHYLQNKTIAAGEPSYGKQDQIPSDECPLSMPLEVKGHQDAMTDVLEVNREVEVDAEFGHTDQTYQSREEKEEEEDLEVDVEENSEDETSQPSLQSAVLFGDVLKTAVVVEGHPATDCSMEASEFKVEEDSKAIRSSPIKSARHSTVREEIHQPEEGVTLSDVSSIKPTFCKSESFLERESKVDISLENGNELDWSEEATKYTTAGNGHVESGSVCRGQRGGQSDANIGRKSSPPRKKRCRSSNSDDTECVDSSKPQMLSPVFCVETTSISSLPGNKIPQCIAAGQNNKPGGSESEDKSDGSDTDEAGLAKRQERCSALRKRSAKEEISLSSTNFRKEESVTPSNSSNIQDWCVSSNQKENSVASSDHDHHNYLSWDDNSEQLSQVLRTTKEAESNPNMESDETDLCRTNKGLEACDGSLTVEKCSGKKDFNNCNKSESGGCLPKEDDVLSLASKDSNREERTATVSCALEEILKVGGTLKDDALENRMDDDGHQDWTGEEDEGEEEEGIPSPSDLPKEGMTVDAKVVTEGERDAFPDFFDGRSSAKTPERYLTIKNHIIQCWMMSKPSYLSKSMVSHGLQNCGSVSVIGEVHRYLELVGAINFETDSPTDNLPEREISLDEDVITEGEKKAMPEFFDYMSSAKTPERYLTIRNHIIKCWQKSKPEYLTKTTARNGLRKSGDVNVIGQIHGYLESVGAINFGTYPPHRVRLKKRRSSKETWSQQSSDAEAKVRRLESMRPRRTMACKKTEIVLQEPMEQGSHREPKPKKLKQPRMAAYDPFKLVECSQFSTDLPAPFSVKISGDVIVTMDLHSHLSTTEVIGLLGGQFDAAARELDMRMAKPCKSLSTGMQCEMDPVSQTEACQSIQEAGCSVIGWYHSHPTFAPNPSIRDIETQTDFQEWFSQDGERPFIGVIVSPYHSRQHVHSKVNCITVSRQWSSDVHTWKPYKFDFSIYQSDKVEESHQKLVSLASSLIDEFAEYKYRVEMLWVCPGQSDMTYLEKMLQSLEANLCGDEETKRETLGKLRRLVLQRFQSKCSTHITDTSTHITDISAHVTEISANTAEIPAHITEIPAHITEIPSHITDTPTLITDSPTPIKDIQVPTHSTDTIVD